MTKELIQAIKKQDWVFWFWTIVGTLLLFYVGYRIGYYQAMIKCLNALS